MSVKPSSATAAMRPARPSPTNANAMMHMTMRNPESR